MTDLSSWTERHIDAIIPALFFVALAVACVVIAISAVWLTGFAYFLVGD